MPEKIEINREFKVKSEKADTGIITIPSMIWDTPTPTINTLALFTCLEIISLSNTETSAKVKALAMEYHIHSIGLSST